MLSDKTIIPQALQDQSVEVLTIPTVKEYHSFSLRSEWVYLPSATHDSIYSDTHLVIFTSRGRVGEAEHYELPRLLADHKV